MHGACGRGRAGRAAAAASPAAAPERWHAALTGHRGTAAAAAGPPQAPTQPHRQVCFGCRGPGRQRQVLSVHGGVERVLCREGRETGKVQGWL